MRQKQRSKNHPTAFPVKNTFPVNSPIPSVQSVPSVASSLGSSIVQGFGFGMGSAVARQAVDSVLNNAPTATPTVTPIPPKKGSTEPCEMALQNLNACVTTSSDCHHFIQEFTKCVEDAKK